MSNIKVSVILPVYNAEKYLVQCMKSIVDQTLREIEIICVDDGSTDDSVKIIKQFAAADPRVHLVSQANAGAGAARNKGMAFASGEYLSFLDSDDFFELNMLEKAYEAAVREKSEIVVFDSDRFDDDKQKYITVSNNIDRQHLPPYSPFDHYAFTGNTFTMFYGWAWDKLFDANFVREQGLYFQEQRTSNDLLFVFSAIVLAKRITIVDSVLVHQRQNNKTSLSNTRERSWDCFYRALCALRENLISYGMMCELQQDFINYALRFSLWHLTTLVGPTQETLFNKLKNEWFQELGVADKPEEYFYDKAKYRELLAIMNHTFEQYSNDPVLRQGKKRTPIQRAKSFLKRLIKVCRRGVS